MSSIEKILAQRKHNATDVRFSILCKACDDYFGKHRQGGASCPLFKLFQGEYQKAWQANQYSKEWNTKPETKKISGKAKEIGG